MQGNFLYNESIRHIKELIQDMIDLLIYLYERADNEKEASLLEGMLDDYQQGTTSCVVEIKGVNPEKVKEYCDKEGIPCCIFDNLTPQMKYAIVRECDIDKVNTFLKAYEKENLALSKIDDEMAIPIIKSAMPLNNEKGFEGLVAVSDTNELLIRLKEEGVKDTFVGFRMENPEGAFVVKVGEPILDKDGNKIENSLEFALWCAEDGYARKIDENDLILYVQEHIENGGKIAFAEGSEIGKGVEKEPPKELEEEIPLLSNQQKEDTKEPLKETKEEEKEKPIFQPEENTFFWDEDEKKSDYTESSYSEYKNEEYKDVEYKDENKEEYSDSYKESHYEDSYNEQQTSDVIKDSYSNIYTDDDYSKKDGKVIDVESTASNLGYTNDENLKSSFLSEKTEQKKQSEYNDAFTKDEKKRREDNKQNIEHSKTTEQLSHEPKNSLMPINQIKSSSNHSSSKQSYHLAFTKEDKKDKQELSRSRNYERTVLNNESKSSRGFERTPNIDSARMQTTKVGFDSSVNKDGNIRQFLDRKAQSIGQTALAPIREMWNDNENEGARQLHSMEKMKKHTLGNIGGLMPSQKETRTASRLKGIKGFKKEEIEAINEILGKRGIKSISTKGGKDFDNTKKSINDFLTQNGINKNLSVDKKRQKLVTILEKQGITKKEARGIANNMMQIVDPKKVNRKKIDVIGAVTDFAEEGDETNSLADFKQAQSIVSNSTTVGKIGVQVGKYSTDIVTRNVIVPVGRYGGKTIRTGTRFVGRLAVGAHNLGMNHVKPYRESVRLVGRLANNAKKVVLTGTKIVGRTAVSIWNSSPMTPVRGTIRFVGRTKNAMIHYTKSAVNTVKWGIGYVGRLKNEIVRVTKTSFQIALREIYSRLMKYRVFRVINNTTKKGMGVVKGVGNTISRFLANEAKGIKHIASVFKTISKALTKIVAIFAVVIFLMYFVGVQLLMSGALSTNVITGFFDSDIANKDVDVLESITGMSYVALLEADRDWIMKIGDIGNNTSLANLKYLEKGVSLDEYYNTGTILGCTGKEGNKLVCPTPFVGAPLDAYKRIDRIDGGTELSYKDGEGNPTMQTTNYKEILSMSCAFFDEDYQNLGKSDNKFTNIAEKVVMYSNKISNMINNVKRHLINAVANFFTGTVLGQAEQVQMLTQEDVKDSYINKAYCLILHSASHQEITELELRVLPIGTEDEANDTFMKALQYCPESESHGCKTFYNFYFTDDGSVSVDGASAIPNGASLIHTEYNCALIGEGEKGGSPCWIPQEESVKNADGDEEIKVTGYKHSCIGGHSGVYCGGHAVAKETAKIYSFTKEQRDELSIKEYDTLYSGIYATDHEDTLYEKVKEGTKYDFSLFNNEIDEEYIDKGKDIFDIDTGIRHAVTPFCWQGWTASNMEKALLYCDADWADLYGINMANYSTAIGGGHGGASNFLYNKTTLDNAMIFETLRKIDEFSDLTDEDIQAIINGTYTGANQRAVTVAYALNWVGRLGYAYGGGRTGRLEDVSATDCSGYVSGVLNHMGLMNGVLTTTGFKDIANSSWANAQAGDILIRWKPDGQKTFNHALLFIGHIDGVPYTLDCSRVNGVGNVYLRSRGEAYYSICYVYNPF